MEDRTPAAGKAKPSPDTSRRSSTYGTGSDTPTQSATPSDSARRRPQAAMQPSGYGTRIIWRPGEDIMMLTPL